MSSSEEYPTRAGELAARIVAHREYAEERRLTEQTETERLQADLAALRESNAALQAQLDAARVAVEKIGGFYHRRACATEVFLPCNCGAAASNAARAEALYALKLKVGE